jgi:hypothetical protein
MNPQRRHRERTEARRLQHQDRGVLKGQKESNVPEAEESKTDNDEQVALGN